MRPDTCSPATAEPNRVASRRRGAGTIGLAAGAAATGVLAGAVVALVADAAAPSWVVGRAAGVASYLLLVALVATGLLLAHPWRTRWARPPAPTRLRLHAALAAATLAVTVLHVAVLAADGHAGVGPAGALLPFGSAYRPLAVTLGLLGAYAGVLAGATAALAGRGTGRVWLPVHRVAATALVLVWGHAVLAGSDPVALRGMYVGTGVVVLALAVSRYLARSRQRPAGRASGAGLHPAARGVRWPLSLGERP